jgi:hypothetical protein
MKIAKATIDRHMMTVFGPRNEILFRFALGQAKEKGIEKLTDKIVQVREGRFLTTFNSVGRVIERRIEQPKPDKGRYRPTLKVRETGHTFFVRQAA